jgi:hypothetical protein
MDNLSTQLKRLIYVLQRIKYFERKERVITVQWVFTTQISQKLKKKLCFFFSLEKEDKKGSEKGFGEQLRGF